MKTCPTCRQPVPDNARFCPIDGTVLKEAENDPLIGQVLAERYLLLEKIGQGNTGDIYRAEHAILRQKIAIKLVHKKLSEEPETILRLREQATVLTKMESDHLVRISDFGAAGDGRFFIAMEFLDGETVATTLGREGKFKEDRARRFLEQIGDALSEGHSLGYVHRDIRPRNVFLTKKRHDEFIKLLNFGFSRPQVSGRQSKIIVGTGLGDPRYFSPEQARGELGDLRSDIYSLGILAYEMVSGSTPFFGAGTFDILTKHLETEPVPLREKMPDISAGYARAVERALKKNPEARFSSVEEFLATLCGRAPTSPEAVTSAKTSLHTHKPSGEGRPLVIHTAPSSEKSPLKRPSSPFSPVTVPPKKSSDLKAKLGAGPKAGGGSTSPAQTLESAPPSRLAFPTSAAKTSAASSSTSGDIGSTSSARAADATPIANAVMNLASEVKHNLDHEIGAPTTVATETAVPTAASATSASATSATAAVDQTPEGSLGANAPAGQPQISNLRKSRPPHGPHGDVQFVPVGTAKSRKKGSEPDLGSYSENIYSQSGSWFAEGVAAEKQILDGKNTGPLPSIYDGLEDDEPPRRKIPPAILIAVIVIIAALGLYVIIFKKGAPDQNKAALTANTTADNAANSNVKGPTPEKSPAPATEPPPEPKAETPETTQQPQATPLPPAEDNAEAKEVAKANAKEEAKAKAEKEAKAKAKAEAEAKAQAEKEAKAQAKAAAEAKAQAEKEAKAKAKAQANAEAEAKTKESSSSKKERQMAQLTALASDAANASVKGRKGGAEKKETVNVLAAPSQNAALGEAKVNEGRAELSKGNYAAARAAFTKGLSLDKNNSGAHAGLGEVAFEMGQYAQAAKHLKTAVSLNPRNSRYLTMLGNSQFKLGQYQAAVDTFQKALARDPQNQAARSGLQVAQKKLGAGDN